MQLKRDEDIFKYDMKEQKLQVINLFLPNVLMVNPDMMCFVQAFSSKKKYKDGGDDDDDADADVYDTYILSNNEESSSKTVKKNFTRKLSFSLKKKSPSCQSSGSISPCREKFESSPIHSLRSNDDMSENQEVSLQQHAAAAAAAEEILTSTPGSSKARQKKFHRHFGEVPQEEKVINYFSCALIGDVLLHGNLYITKNYFAFYSNHFGNINKILIPTASILKITKEKTVLIKPSAVAVITVKEKYSFGLFLSRDTTYKLMIQVWNAAMKLLPSQYLSPYKEKDIPQISTNQDQQSGYEDESSLSGSDINVRASPDLLRTSYSKKYNKSTDNTDSTINSAVTGGSRTVSSGVDVYCQTVIPTLSQYIHSRSKANFILGTSTILLAILFFSAGILLYRISCLQQNYSQTNYLTSTRSINEVQEFLSLNLHYISKVRKSLEALSTLLDQEPLSNIVQSNIDATTKNVQS